MYRNTHALMVIALILLSVGPVTTAQAFSFCFSFGGKQRSDYNNYPPSYGFYGDYGQYVAVPGMSYRPGAIDPYHGNWYPAPYRQPWAEHPVPLQNGYE